MQTYKILGADGKEYGPVDADGVRQWYAQRRVIASTSIRSEASSEWKPLSAYPEFQDLLDGSSGLPPLPGPFAGGPAPGAIPAARLQSGLAVVSLVLGILSIPCPLGLPSLAAIITGHIASSRARKSPAKFGGSGMALAGLIMGYVSLLLTLVLAGLLLQALSRAKYQNQRIQCAHNLKQITIGARIYASDNKGFFPTNYLSMSNELMTPKLLVCPADRKHTAVETWAEFNPSKHLTYEFLKPGIHEDKAATQVIFRCPIHNNIGLGDGSAKQLPKN